MDSFWVKILILGIIIAALVIGVKFLAKKGNEALTPDPNQKTFYDMAKRDKEEFRVQHPEETEQVQQQKPPAVEDMNQSQPAAEQQMEESVAAKPEFRQLDEIERVQADKLMEGAIMFRSEARLPGMSYQKMVDLCRRIIQDFPGTEYEYNAKRMMAEVPKDKWQIYNITEEEVKTD